MHETFSRMIHIQKKIKELKALRSSKKIGVTLWTDNWRKTGVGGVTGCESFFTRAVLNITISKELKRLRDEFSQIISRLPKDKQEDFKNRSIKIALEERF